MITQVQRLIPINYTHLPSFFHTMVKVSKLDLAGKRDNCLWLKPSTSARLQKILHGDQVAQSYVSAVDDHAMDTGPDDADPNRIAHRIYGA